MHIGLKIVIALILIYIFDKWAVQAWMDYPKILVKEPISMKSSLNYTKEHDFKVGRPEKGINWSMSFWMYIKDLHYREGRKKIIMKTPAFEMYLHETQDKLLIKIPYYKMPCTINRCGGNDCNSIQPNNYLSRRTSLMSNRETINTSLETFNKKLILLKEAKDKFNQEKIVVGNSPTSSTQASTNYTEPDRSKIDNGVYTCGPSALLTGAAAPPAAATTGTGVPRVKHTICGAEKDKVQYCNHLSGYCSRDESTKQLSLAVGGIYNSDFVESDPGKGIESYYTAYNNLLIAIEDYKIAKHNYENAKTNYEKTKKSSVGYSIIEFKNIPIQRWINLVLLVNNRHIDLWINNELIESRYLPNVPLLSNITFDTVSCRDGFNGYISALTVWDHLITRNMIYYLTTNSPVSSSFYDNTFGFYVKSVDKLIKYIKDNIVNIKIIAPKSKSLPKKLTDKESCK